MEITAAPLPPDSSSQDCDPPPAAPLATGAGADAQWPIHGGDRRTRHRQLNLFFRSDHGSRLRRLTSPAVARDLRCPVTCQYRILSAAEPVTALQRVAGRHRRQDVSITASGASGQLLTVYRDANQRILAPRDSPITKVSDLSGKSGSVWPGRIVAPYPGDRTASRHCVGGELGRTAWWPCSSADRRCQHRRLHLAGLVEEDPYLHHIVGPDAADQPLRRRDQPGQHRIGPVRQQARSNASCGTWNTLSQKWLTVLEPAPPAHAEGMWTDGQSVKRPNVRAPGTNRRTPRPRRPRQFDP